MVVSSSGERAPVIVGWHRGMREREREREREKTEGKRERNGEE